MMPPGRRRSGALSPLMICLAVLVLFTATARAAVLGLDFGTLHIKAALVKPGIPLDIVLTKDSKRKEIAAVAFKPARDENNQVIVKLGTYPERAYGSDALALQGRMPGEVFPNLKQILGHQWGDEAEKAAVVYTDQYPAVKIEHLKELGTTAFKSSAFVDEVVPFSVEELIGMELANIKRNAEAMAGAGNLVEDTVITIPAFYTADEKRAIVKAANFAGLTVNALITDGLAVGLDYAKSRTFPEVSKGEKPEYHLVYDMGAGSTTATIMRFQGRSVKDVGRFSKTVQEVAVVGSGWDRTMGGDVLTQVVITDYITKLMTKPVIKSRGTQREEITSNGRVMSRIYKEAEKARQVLSANTETSSSFEELLPDVDFRVKLSRSEFETLTTDFAARVEGPILDALAMANLTMADINSVILHGGAVRTPFVQKKLEGIVRKAAKLKSNVNADESAVFGAAFKAAGLSPSFKVKEIRDSDIPGYPTSLVYTDGGKERKSVLFAANSPVGANATTKQVTFKDKEDFTFRFTQNVNHEDRPVVQVKTENLTASVQELVRKFGCEKDAIKTKMSIRLGSAYGLPEVVSGTVSCEVDDIKTGSVGDTVKDWLGFGKKKDQVPLGEEDESAGPTEQMDATESATSTSEAESTSTSSDAKSSASSKAAEAPKKRIETIPILLTTSAAGNPQPSAQELKRIQERLKEFDQSDRARVAREEAQNALESYTYFVRDFLTNIDFESFSTKVQRADITKLLESTRDWMDSPGEAAKATKEVLKEKLNALKKLVEPIQSRRKEEGTRPERIAGLKKSLDETGKLLLQLENQVQSAVAAQSAASMFESSNTQPTASTSADAESSPTASASDDLDDLEEAESTTSTPLAPKYSGPADFNIYASLDLSDIREKYDSVNQWLAEKEAEQAKLKPFDEPVLLTRDLETKANVLAKAMEDLVYKQMKAARSTSSKKPKPTKSSSKAGKKGKSTSTESTAAAESTDVPIKDVPIEEGGDDNLDDFLQSVKSSQDTGGKTTKRDEL